MDSAADSPAGSMNISAAKLSAAWCAATVVAPNELISSATPVKAATSARLAPPIGSPRRSSLRQAAASGRDQPANTGQRR